MRAPSDYLVLLLPLLGREKCFVYAHSRWPLPMCLKEGSALLTRVEQFQLYTGMC